VDFHALLLLFLLCQFYCCWRDICRHYLGTFLCHPYCICTSSASDFQNLCRRMVLGFVELDQLRCRHSCIPGQRLWTSFVPLIPGIIGVHDGLLASNLRVWSSIAVGCNYIGAGGYLSAEIKLPHPRNFRPGIILI